MWLRNQGLGTFERVDVNVDNSFSSSTRIDNLETMSADPVDVLVVGAGITGAAVARDAAMRGLRVSLIDRGDFGAETSSNSSKLIHGGLRYLETGQWRLVFESCRERRHLLHMAPHLVRPRPFLFPIFEGGRIPRWRLAAALTLYDLLAGLRNVRLHRMLGKRGALRREANLRTAGLRGAGLYYDAECDDARLTLATVRSAHRHGAFVANYVAATSFERAGGRICGVRATDRITGQSYALPAQVVVNATGPWSDELGDGSSGPPLLRRTKGAHVTVPRQRLGNDGAITLLSPIDGRVLFIVPWGDLSYIGTTETEENSHPDQAEVESGDVVYLLRSANAVFPRARLTPDDVVSTWVGVRPLVRSDAPAHNTPNTVPRDHRIVSREDGLVVVAGGKLTTHRAMAADVVDVVTGLLEELDGRRAPARPATASEPLPGGEVRDTDLLVQDIEREGFTPEVARHLVQALGTEAAAVVRLAQGHPEWAHPIVPGYPVLRAQIVHAVRREMAMTLDDLMRRRTRIFYQVVGHGVPEAPAVAELAGEELGWDDGRKAAELARYLDTIRKSMAFRQEDRVVVG